MKFTPPVIAAISVGSLVVLSLIVGGVLYARGFFDGGEGKGKEAEKPAPKDEFTLAVERAKPYLNNEVIFNALLTSNFASEEVKDEFEKWDDGLDEISDKTAMEILLDTFVLCSKAELEKVKKYIGNEEQLTKAIRDSETLFSSQQYTAYQARSVFGFSFADSWSLFTNTDSF